MKNDDHSVPFFARRKLDNSSSTLPICAKNELNTILMSDMNYLDWKILIGVIYCKYNIILMCEILFI